MVKLDAQVLRYMSKEEFRVLTAIEMGMKNHEIVPTTLICRIAGLKSGGAFKNIKLLHKNKLVYHDAKKYDGYKLTYAGYDYLALKTLVQRGAIAGIGRKIGVGKESDIYEVIDPAGQVKVLKIHRLGRISFRKIKEKRDYLLKRTHASWLYMSRLAAAREYAYMQALYKHGFPVPTPYDQNRHVVLMSAVDAYPFGQVSDIRDLPKVYATLMNLITRLAEHGLIHCDFNEFNLMISADSQITMIDFPQMVSTSHENAEYYFDRDVQCIRTYFLKRFKYNAEEYPRFFEDTTRKIDLDKVLSASGADAFTKEERANFESFLKQNAEALGNDTGDEEASIESESDEEGSEESDVEGDSELHAKVIENEEASEKSNEEEDSKEEEPGNEDKDAKEEIENVADADASGSCVKGDVVRMRELPSADVVRTRVKKSLAARKPRAKGGWSRNVHKGKEKRALKSQCKGW